MERLGSTTKTFVDTSAFIALAVESDADHEAAYKWSSNLSRRTRLITTSFIVDETVTRIRVLAGIKKAYDVAQELLKAGNYQVVWISQSHCLKALEKMKKFFDKRLSFTDCTSFVVMEELGIKDAFTFDHDFVRAGFQVHPEA